MKRLLLATAASLSFVAPAWSQTPTPAEAPPVQDEATATASGEDAK